MSHWLAHCCSSCLVVVSVGIGVLASVNALHLTGWIQATAGRRRMLWICGTRGHVERHRTQVDMAAPEANAPFLMLIIDDEEDPRAILRPASTEVAPAPLRYCRRRLY